MKAVWTQIKKWEASVFTTSAKIILGSFLSVVTAEVFASYIIDCWRDQVAAIVVGVITYSCLQILTLVRYVR